MAQDVLALKGSSSSSAVGMPALTRALFAIDFTTLPSSFSPCVWATRATFSLTSCSLSEDLVYTATPQLAFNKRGGSFE